MAYLHHSFRPALYSGPKPDSLLLGRGKEDILNVLDFLRLDKMLDAYMNKRKEEIEYDSPILRVHTYT